MRKAEQKMWDFIRPKMKGLWDVQRHEDKYSQGVPDLSFGIQGINGWIELKIMPKYPKNMNRPFMIRHFTPYQKNWLKKRQKYGGNCWLLLRIEDDFLLFKGDNVERLGNVWTAHELKQQCHSLYSLKMKTIVFNEWLYQNLLRG